MREQKPIGAEPKVNMAEVAESVKTMLANLPAMPDGATAKEDGYPTVVLTRDQPGAGGAHHEYVIAACDEQGDPRQDVPIFAKIYFQNGGRAVNGVNGCTELDLLGIIVHRLTSFQSGPFPSRDNERALQALDSAMYWINHRTAERTARGVEGTEQA